MQNRQNMGNQMSQGMSPGMGNGSLGRQLMQQIEQWKLQMGYGNKPGGKAASGWGLGTSPYAVTPAPADPSNQVEDRQGDQSLGDTAPVDFEPLYAPEDVAHGFSSENQLHGDLDLSATPQKIEEVRSAPENQEALMGYADVIGTYVEGEESAINREQVPLEYQELVRLYFDQLALQSRAGGVAAEDGETDEAAAETAGESEDSAEDAG